MNSRSRKQNSNRQTIIVIGAGLAGLSCAYQLKRNGHDVLILEASDRIGGRIRTLRKPFSDGLFAEAGAYYISDQHKLLTHYLTVEFKNHNLKLSTVLPKEASIWYYMHDLSDPWFEITPARGLGDLEGNIPREAWPSPFELTSHERSLGLYRFLSSYFSFADASQAWSPTDLTQLDKTDFLSYLRRRGASPGAIKLLQSWFVPYLDEFENISALGLLREAAIGRNLPLSQVQTWSTLDAGMEKLPKAFADSLPSEAIRLKSPVKEIVKTGNGVKVRYCYLETKSFSEVLADQVVCTAPFSTLGNINFNPSISREKQRAMKELSYASVVRIYLQFADRIWVKQPWKGAVYTTLPIMNLIDSTFHQKDKTKDRIPGILHAYLSGKQARIVQAMRPDERIEFALNYMDIVYPGLKKSFTAAGNRGTSVCWDNEEWTRGAYTYFKPGQMTSLLPHISSPEWDESGEKRLHFAGDHTSSRPGWMEGALQSGHRATIEIDPSISIAH